MRLSPCLFENSHPELITIELAKQWLIISIDWNPIVHHYLLDLSVYAQQHLVYTVLVEHRLPLEDILDADLIFTDGCQRRKEIAVANVALQDIAGLDVTLE